MKRSILVVGLISGLIAAAATSLYADGKHHVRAGKWHTSVKSEMVGAPFTPPPMEVDRCVTPEEAADPQKMLKKQQEDCDPANVVIDGNHVTYKVTCHKRGGTQTGAGELTFGDDSYTGTMTLDIDTPRMGKMKLVQHIEAKRTGDCTP
jgi:hypothetical protein